MIVVKEEEKEYICVDIGRPDFYNDEMRDNYLKLHNFIKNTECNILVNNAFYFVDDLLEQGSGYSGGGMKYMFWLESKEDLQVFTEQIGDIFGEHGIRVFKSLNPDIKL